MRTRIAVAAVSLVLVTLAGRIHAGQAQQPRPQAGQGRGGLTLAVEVTDPGGNALEDVQVAVSGPVERSGTTGDKGTLALRTLRPGTYRLRFERDGFITLERELTVRAGSPASVSVALSPSPEPPAPASKPAEAAEPRPAPDPEPARLPRAVEPRVLSIPDYLDDNLIGSQPQRTTLLGCAEGGTTRLLQIREPLPEQLHADVDELLYVVAGNGTLRLPNQETRMQPGHYALVPRGVPHSVRRDGRNPIILLSVLAGAPCTEPAPPER